MTHDLRDKGARGSALHELTRLGGATMGIIMLFVGLSRVRLAGSRTDPPTATAQQ